MLNTFSLGARSALIVASLSVSLLLAGCNDGPKSSGTSMAETGSVEGSLESAINDTPIESDRVTLVVYGMSCPLCATNVDKQLLAVKGVENVDVDLSTGNIDVLLAAKPRPTSRQLAAAVQKSGFTLKDIKKN